MRRNFNRVSQLSSSNAPVPLFIILPVIFLILFVWLSIKGNRALRCLSHLSSASRAAVHSMCFATSDSLQAIKVAAARPQFITTMQQLIDAKV